MAASDGWNRFDRKSSRNSLIERFEDSLYLLNVKSDIRATTEIC